MKLLIKKIVLPTIACLLFTCAFAQTKLDTAVLTKDWMFDSGKYVDTTKATPQQMARIHKAIKGKALKKDRYHFEGPYKNIGVRFTGGSGKKSEIYQGNYWGRHYNSIIIDGNCSVEFSALEVTEDNAADFIYHVVQNDTKELVRWTKPSVFKYTADGKAKYAYLGKFNYVPGQVLKIEIYNVNDYRHLDAVMVDWREVKAPDVFGSVDFFPTNWRVDRGFVGRPMTELQKTTERYGVRVAKNKWITKERPVQVKDFIETTNVNDIKVRADDSVKNMTFIFLNNLNRSLNYNNKITLTTHTGNKPETIQLGETDDRIHLYKEIWKTPGKYTITFTPKLKRHGGSPITLLHNLSRSISFTVLPPEHKDIPLKTVVSIILVLITATAIMFTLLRNKQKRKLAQEAQSRQIATLQLQSVRSQLNPHFIFNALAGIQNLINKNAIEDANKYLTRFARLTRNVLDDGQRDLVSIEKETKLLDDYLQMEQTRFGFNYKITVDDAIDPQIEIPAMLLQPFVENAVKHGISALKDKGLVDVSIAESGKDILLKVQDNGKGFNLQQTDGKGIKLCKERIALFNSIHKKTPILLHIKPTDDGTQIVIELKNWL